MCMQMNANNLNNLLWQALAKILNCKLHYFHLSNTASISQMKAAAFIDLANCIAMRFVQPLGYAACVQLNCLKA